MIVTTSTCTARDQEEITMQFPGFFNHRLEEKNVKTSKGILVKVSPCGGPHKVLASAALGYIVLQINHDSTCRKHAERTLYRIKREYWWPRMTKCIVPSVLACDMLANNPQLHRSTLENARDPRHGNFVTKRAGAFVAQNDLGEYKEEN